MPQSTKKISLIYFVVLTLLLIGLVPLLLTGWFLSDRSGRELRAVENRYQTQLVQEKASRIEMFGRRYGDLVDGFAKALEISDNLSVLSSPEVEKKFGETLKENPNLIALYIKPVQGESLSVFRPEMIEKPEIEKITATLLANLNEAKVIFGEPQKLADNNKIVFSIAAPVKINNKISAGVVAVVSLDEISQMMSGVKSASEAELWKAGLPIVFVVDKNGRAIFHPDSKVVESGRKFDDLKIVQEWQQANSGIQSALVPFSAEYNEQKYEMIGAYSTANFSKNLKFGVIAMQDENKALASVGEMRRQTWFISLAFAVVALILGSIFAKLLTSPLLKLVSAAQKIAGGDLSERVETKNITEIGTLGETFNLMAGKVEEHIAKLAKAAEDNRELFVGTVKALAAAIDGKDHYTRGHSERVSRISVAIGQRLGMDEEEAETLRISALLHDIGKIAVDDAILNKPTALTNDEFEIMKTHPAAGYKILKNIPAMKNFLPGLHMHHEMVNGAGYPQGLKGDQIPLQAKIISVADTFDAMTIDRPYQKGMELGAALDRIESFVGTRYDENVVRALIEACHDGQIGIGIVKLRNFKKNEEKILQAA